MLSTKWIGKLFLIINKPRYSKKKICDKSFFKNVSLIERNLEIDLLDGFIVFF
jgi:hypothetical protein